MKIINPAGVVTSVQVMNIKNILPHSHKTQLELVYCLSGSLTVHTAHEFCPLKEGELIVCDVMDVRCMFSDSDNITLVAHIDMGAFDLTEDQINGTLFSCWSEEMEEWQRPYHDRICTMLLTLAYEFFTCCNEEVEAGIATNIIKDLMKYFSWIDLTDHPNTGRYADRYAHIINYIGRNCTRKLTVTELAKVLYLSPTYISNFCSRTNFHTFTTIVRYFKALTVQHYLVETDIPIGKIWELCGYSSAKYFFNDFKFMFNMTPLQYRKKLDLIKGTPESGSAINKDQAVSLLRDNIMQNILSEYSGEISR